jgi:hypothetical protein
MTQQSPYLQSILSVMLVILSLAGCGVQEGGSHETDPSKSTNPTPKAAAINRCRKLLHRVSNQNDLIQQMYQTALRDDCLYAMDLDELQRVWDIPVQDDWKKPAPVSRIGVWVEKSSDFVIYPNSVNFRTEYERDIQPKSMFADNYFPSFLPRPIVKDKAEEQAKYGPPTDGVILDYDYKSNSPQPGFIQAGYSYSWKHDERTMEAVNLYGSIIRIEFDRRPRQEAQRGY